MGPSEHPAPDENDFALESLVADCLSALEADGTSGVERICDAHPRHAGELRARVARLQERGLVRRPPLTEIGPYRVLRPLGRGGMGEVFLAEQRSPIRRLVALKLVRDDTASESVIARFDAERQALAIMEHPGIARVFDAGTTVDGRPFFVMEFVDGQPVTEFCDGHRLPVRDRLRLFAEICDAVHHAHQNGVIHRDLKPSNVLVRELDGRVVPKVIDFGLAKALRGGLTPHTLQTHDGQVLGTPAYMSPEQASGDGRGVDVRTDVYALGAMLYELVSGSRPFDDRRLEAAGMLELLRILREEEPPPPSTRLATLGDHDLKDAAARRRTSASVMLRSLRGETDWIVGRAMAKSPRDRYPSVSELAADIRRHLANEPVLAGPPTTVYRLRKFAGRHPLGLSMGTVAFVTALLVLAVILRLGFEARTNLRRFDRLAGRESVAALLRQADAALWPAQPDMVPAMRRWLERARQMSNPGTTAAVAAEIAELGTRRLALAPNERVLLDGLVALAADLEALTGDTGAIRGMEARITWAEGLPERSITAHADAWSEAVEFARTRHGITLRPLVGLVPLGEDPDSHLYEFAVLTPEGRTPGRATDGHVHLVDPLDDPVLVLVPAGEVTIGSQDTDPDAPFYDDLRGSDELTTTTAHLDPFLIAKFEITQAQWHRVMNTTPSVFAPGQQAGRGFGVRSGLHPVENVSWVECAAFCQRLGLEIPMEGQWEVAARAGTHWPWCTGPLRASLRTAANLSDKTRAERFAVAGRVEPDFDDGFAVHAPVGSLRPNGFGLHDVHGNVWEWCRTTMVWPPLPADLDRVQVWRGGGFMSDAANARITYAIGESARNRRHFLGLRPVLTIAIR